MSDDDIKIIEGLIKKHKPGSFTVDLLLVLFMLFLCGWFKGCGY